jgi:putative sterol carrier protein
MAYRFGTAEYARALCEEINRSSEYRNAASKWGVGFNGNILFTFDADDALRNALHLLVRLQSGRCDGAEFVPGPSHPDAGFTLRAPFRLWREILERRTLAATAILTGKMKVDGDMITLLKHAGSSRSLIHCVASIPTEFPG